MTHLVKVLYGPTASGKTAAALKYAAENDVVIINADAMQCYADLPLLTAQPTLEEQKQAPHRLYGVIDGSENIIVTTWRELALKEIDQALTDNKLPVLVGGTGFYLKALMEGLSEIPDIPADIRDKGIEIFEAHGLDPLLKDLMTHNEADMTQLDTQNPRRVIRAWEVMTYTGKSLATWQRENPTQAPPHLKFDLQLVTRSRTELVQRIHSRFDLMMENGVMDEVEYLSNRIDQGDVAEDNLVIKAHGFRPLHAYLKGTLSREDAVERSKIETRQYAKRQMTWARQQFGFKG